MAHRHQPISLTASPRAQVQEQRYSLGKLSKLVPAPVIPGFNAKPNTQRMCAQEPSFHRYHTENGYRITNVTIYSTY
jgi:hypothetical protein